ncbi:hypothetical protein ASC95_23600 [Pelomonas sp. Root1217]|uniref:type II CAAX endopeptidase family protein n=1 Tax=Pelomonas sp. Root1217 TaxID=1736430 RepID=UPI00071418A8|nr:type II CAAX endopeptidase family protein [Pelomonas sp. Root1217]KQV47179.1 hypothetical protein ASC95_23600 [Pelomonas sp. Root1217]
MNGLNATRPAPGALQMFWLLTRLRLRRLYNLLGVVGKLSFGRSKKTAQGRTGTAKKALTGPILGLVMALFMMLTFGNMAFQSLVNLHDRVDGEQPRLEASAPRAEAGDETTEAGQKHRGKALERGAFSPQLLQATTGLATLLLLVTIFNEIGARELAKPEWDMEWLVTLPIAMPTLLWARLVERTFTSAFGLIAFLPLCTVLAWLSGTRWWLAPLLGLAMTIPLCALSALGRSLVDTGLRLKLAPSKLRNLQALMSVLGVAGMYLALSLSSQGSAQYGLQVVTALPSWALWAPPGLLVQALNAAEGWQGLLFMLAAVAQILVLAALGVAWMRHQLRHGVLAGGGRETGGRAGAAPPVRAAGAAWLIKSAVHRRELLLLARDRNFLIQTLLLPVVILGGQFVMNSGFSALAGMWNGPPAMVASAAFGVASYMLMMSAFQTLNTEGAALWLLYSFPRSIASVLKEKAQLWAVLALIYPLMILLPGLVLREQAQWRFLGHALLALAGVPIYAVIAVALAVFASDPLAQEQRSRVRPRYLYLFMLLSSFYVYGIWAAQWWQSVEIALLAALLAMALWQKASDQLPFLLDPVAAPPARASAADGLIAAMVFLIGQIGIAAVWLAIGPKATGAALLASFVGSGAITYGLLRLVYWRTGTQRLPRVLGPEARAPATWRIGAVMGVAAAGLGLVYVVMLQHLDLLPAHGPKLRLWLLALCVVAAPVFEEFIFRGLIFGGLRRSMRLLPAAAASAAVFAIVHPPASIIPVFFLGLCAAMAYERSRSLAAPMLTHAIYNAVVVGYQWLAPAQ